MIVPTVTPSLACATARARCAAGDQGFETIVVDNGTGAAELEEAAAGLEGASVLRLDDERRLLPSGEPGR